MNCTKTQHRLLKTESQETLPREVAAHLVQCPACQAYLRRLRSLEAAVPLLPVPASSGKERLLSRVFSENASAPSAPALLPFARRTWTPRRLVSVAAAAAVLIAAGLWLGNYLSNWNRPIDQPLVQQQREEIPQKALVARLLEADLRLAESKEPRQRVESLAELAVALQGETDTLASTGSAVELHTVAQLYEKVVRDGVVVKARTLPRDQRRQVLPPIAEQLAKVERAARRQAVDAPQGTGVSLLQVANAAKDGNRELLALMQEEAAQ